MCRIKANRCYCKGRIRVRIATQNKLGIFEFSKMACDVNNYKRYAFISYSHKDAKEAKWLHKHLEAYKLPSEIYNEYDSAERYLRPIFRDKEDIKSGKIKSELRKELEASKYLIVVCSPNSARSEWVSQEIQVFIELGRVDRIIPFVVDGRPLSRNFDECFPKSLLNHIEINPDDELLGVSVREVGKEKALVRVVSTLLSVDFDTLWKRHERERKQSIITGCSLVFISVLCLSWLLVPITLAINIHDDSHNLPLPKDAKCIVDNDVYLLNSLDTILLVRGIPGYCRLTRSHVKFSATYYETISKNIMLNICGKTNLKVNLKRDDTFAIFSGYVRNENDEPVCGAIVQIEDLETLTDSLGYFNIRFETTQQSIQKTLQIIKDGYYSLIRNEIPFEGATYYIFSK